MANCLSPWLRQRKLEGQAAIPVAQDTAKLAPLHMMPLGASLSLLGMSEDTLSPSFRASS